mgnify:CR=1 FL=1
MYCSGMIRQVTPFDILLKNHWDSCSRILYFRRLFLSTGSQFVLSWEHPSFLFLTSRRVPSAAFSRFFHICFDFRPHHVMLPSSWIILSLLTIFKLYRFSVWVNSFPRHALGARRPELAEESSFPTANGKYDMLIFVGNVFSWQNQR